jgi:mono/diheme cytochrome c family protein
MKVLIFLVLSGSGWLYLSPAARPIRHPQSAIRNSTDSGKVVYETYCLACHQANGKGVPGMNPPLVKTEWVLGDKTRLIGVVLNGLNDAIEIGGETYDNAMPAHNFLNDRQIADVLTYVRSHFGNEASAIRPEEVAVVRAKK